MDDLIKEYQQTLAEITAKRREVVRKLDSGEGDQEKLMRENELLYAIQCEKVQDIQQMMRSKNGDVRF